MNSLQKLVLNEIHVLQSSSCPSKGNSYSEEIIVKFDYLSDLMFPSASPQNLFLLSSISKLIKQNGIIILELTEPASFSQTSSSPSPSSIATTESSSSSDGDPSSTSSFHYRLLILEEKEEKHMKHNSRKKYRKDDSVIYSNSEFYKMVEERFLSSSDDRYPAHQTKCHLSVLIENPLISIETASHNNKLQMNGSAVSSSEVKVNMFADIGNIFVFSIPATVTSNGNQNNHQINTWNLVESSLLPAVPSLSEESTNERTSAIHVRDLLCLPSSSSNSTRIVSFKGMIIQKELLFDDYNNVKKDNNSNKSSSIPTSQSSITSASSSVSSSSSSSSVSLSFSRTSLSFPSVPTFSSLSTSFLKSSTSSSSSSLSSSASAAAAVADVVPKPRKYVFYIRDIFSKGDFIQVYIGESMPKPPEDVNENSGTVDPNALSVGMIVEIRNAHLVSSSSSQKKKKFYIHLPNNDNKYGRKASNKSTAHSPSLGKVHLSFSVSLILLLFTYFFFLLEILGIASLPEIHYIHSKSERKKPINNPAQLISFHLTNPTRTSPLHGMRQSNDGIPSISLLKLLENHFLELQHSKSLKKVYSHCLWKIRTSINFIKSIEVSIKCYSCSKIIIPASSSSNPTLPRFLVPISSSSSIAASPVVSLPTSCPRCYASYSLDYHWKMMIAIDDGTNEANLHCEDDLVKQILFHCLSPSPSTHSTPSSSSSNQTNKAAIKNVILSIEQEVAMNGSFRYDPIGEIIQQYKPIHLRNNNDGNQGDEEINEHGRKRRKLDESNGKKSRDDGDDIGYLSDSLLDYLPIDSSSAVDPFSAASSSSSISSFAFLNELAKGNYLSHPLHSMKVLMKFVNYTRLIEVIVKVDSSKYFSASSSASSTFGSTSLSFTTDRFIRLQENNNYENFRYYSSYSISSRIQQLKKLELQCYQIIEMTPSNIAKDNDEKLLEVCYELLSQL
jgi:hypothetical protein